MAVSASKTRIPKLLAFMLLLVLGCAALLLTQQTLAAVDPTSGSYQFTGRDTILFQGTGGVSIIYKKNGDGGLSGKYVDSTVVTNIRAGNAANCDANHYALSLTNSGTQADVYDLHHPTGHLCETNNKKGSVAIQAQAQPIGGAGGVTAFFTDHAHIQIDGTSDFYVDGSIDNPLNYFGAKICGSSTNVIEDFSGTGAAPDLSKGATLKTWSTPGGGNTSCNRNQDQHVTFRDTANFDVYFHWLDSGLIRPVDDNSGKDFTLDTNLGYFIGKEGSGSCRDLFQVGADKNTGTLFLANGHQYGEGWPGEPGGPIHPQGSTVINGCTYYSGITMKLGDASVNGAKPPGTGASSSGSSDDQACADQSLAFAWLVCPAIKVGNSMVSYMFQHVVQPLLAVTPLSKEPNLEAIWRAMRDLANVFFVLIFLFIILANVLSINIDAYTFKKMVPRLVAAAIFVQFSYIFCSIIVDIGNVLGAGVAGLVAVAVPSQFAGGSDPSYWASGIGVGILSIVAIGAVIIIGLPTVILALVAVLIGLLGMVVTLILRQLIISVLVILSPLALAAWVLPNTENLFKQWYRNLTRLVLMYPLIVLMLTVAKAMSTISNSTDFNNVPALTGNFASLVTGFLPVIALFSIPATFKMAGGLMNMTGNAIGKLSGRGAQKLTGGQLAKDIRQAQREKNLERAQRGGLSGAIGTLGAGGVGAVLPGRLGAAGRRRLQAGYQQDVIKRQGDEVEAQIDNMTNSDGTPLSGKDRSSVLQSIAMGSDTYTNEAGQTVKHGVKTNDAARARAMALMAKSQQWDKLREMQQQFRSSNDQAGQRLMTNTLRADNDTFKKAPDLLQGPSAFDNISAEKVVDYDASTINELGDYLRSLPTEVNAEAGVTQEHVNHANSVRSAAFNAINEVASSQARRGRMNASAVQALSTFHTAPEGAGEAWTPVAPPVGFANSAEAFRPDGTVTAPPRSGPTEDAGA